MVNDFGYGMEFGLMETLFPIIFITIFVIVIVTFIIGIGNGVKEWSSNNNSLLVTVEATIVDKRTDVYHSHDNNTNSTSRHSTYYITFELRSGERIELTVPVKEYGMLVIGDYGKLTHQGTRYKGFERNM